MTQKIKINLWVISTLILYSISPMYAQHERFNKNALYGSFGVSKFFTVTAFYERILTQKKGPSTFLKVGNGAYGGYAESGKYILLHYGILTGIKKHHLEISAALIIFIQKKIIDLNLIHLSQEPLVGGYKNQENILYLGQVFRGRKVCTLG